MIPRISCFCLAVLVGNSSLAAQSKGKPGPSGEVEIHFANGSIVRMTILSEKVEIATRYGKLEVPVKEIKNIEFGLHLPPGHEEKIAQLIHDLGSTEFRKREAAGKGLVELGHFGYHALQQASKSNALEVANRAQEALKKLEEQVPVKFLRLKDEDRVVTDKFTIVGKIATASLKAKTEYFGDVELSLGKMMTLRALGASGDAEIALDAAKFANPGAWLETDYHHDGRGTLIVTAAGQVDLWPETPGQYMTTPKGYMIGQMFWGPGVNAQGVDPRRFPGMVIGKVGPNGTLFTIGERYEGVAGEGKLFLHIGPSPWNNASSGSYQIRIMTKD